MIQAIAGTMRSAVIAPPQPVRPFPNNRLPDPDTWDDNALVHYITTRYLALTPQNRALIRFVKAFSIHPRALRYLQVDPDALESLTNGDTSLRTSVLAVLVSRVAPLLSHFHRPPPGVQPRSPMSPPVQQANQYGVCERVEILELASLPPPFTSSSESNILLDWELPSAE
ncbi:hypothetical protein C8Q73DRAFT_669812 [Cubamyces lactineus]|nr:hypothetical protein C8Q73DRAFT_669812 [Cubamyces lactineus]